MIAVPTPSTITGYSTRPKVAPAPTSGQILDGNPIAPLHSGWKRESQNSRIPTFSTAIAAEATRFASPAGWIASSRGSVTNELARIART